MKQKELFCYDCHKEINDKTFLGISFSNEKSYTRYKMEGEIVAVCMDCVTVREKQRKKL